jgi:rod shape-determining protein MreD
LLWFVSKEDVVRTAGMIAGLYAAFVIQTSVLPLLRAGSWAPHVVMWGVVLAAVRPGPWGIVTAAACGLVSDCLSPGPLGVDLCVFALAAGLVQSARKRRASTGPFGMGFLTGATVLFAVSASTALRLALEGQPIPLPPIATFALATALATAVLAAVASGLWRAGTCGFSAGGRSAGPQVSNRWRMLAE